MFQELFSQQISIILLSFTLQNSNALIFLLLNSFSPNNNELRNANQTFNSALQESTNLLTPIKYCSE